MVNKKIKTSKLLETKLLKKLYNSITIIRTFDLKSSFFSLKYKHIQSPVVHATLLLAKVDKSPKFSNFSTLEAVFLNSAFVHS